MVPNMKNGFWRRAAIIRPGNGDDAPQSESYTAKQQGPARNTLARHIANRNWSKIERILLPDSAFYWVEIDEHGNIDENNILMFALRHNPPFEIIKLLAFRYPECLTWPDYSTGMYAIHVAAKFGAAPSIMKFLADENEHAAGVQDPSGKAPIHYVGEFYAINHHESYHRNRSIVDDDMLQVVRILRKAAPKSFNLEDGMGCNAIEYALESGANMKVIQMMQRTARDDWRTLKANGREYGKKHEDMARQVQRSASVARLKVSGSRICVAQSA